MGVTQAALQMKPEAKTCHLPFYFNALGKTHSTIYFAGILSTRNDLSMCYGPVPATYHRTVEILYTNDPPVGLHDACTMKNESALNSSSWPCL